jgi:hypothetical protein
MSTGLKVVLIGCISVIVIGVLALGVGGYLVKNWWSEKRETIENVIGTEESEYGKKVAELNQKHPFIPPADNIVKEDRLQRYLEVRKTMNVVYKQHEAEIKKIADSSSATPGDLFKSATFIKDLRLAQVKGLQAQGMSKDEYTYLTQMVYVNWVAMMANEAIQGSNSAVDQLKKSMEQIDQQLASPGLPEDQRQQLQLTKDSYQKQLEQLAEIEKGLQQVPKENIELFKKYDQDIRQNGMTGLEFLGL